MSTNQKLKQRCWVSQTLLDLCLNFYLVSLLSTLHKKWEYKNAVETTILSHVGVTIDGVLDRWMDLLTTYTCHSELACANSSQSITVSTSHFLALDFNTGTITVSLNYILQTSHVKSSFHSHTLATLFFTASHTELHWTEQPKLYSLTHQPITPLNWSGLNWTACLRSSLYSLVADPTENTVLLLLRACSFPPERVYRAVA
jgi:hypothetical protein